MSSNTFMGFVEPGLCAVSLAQLMGVKQTQVAGLPGTLIGIRLQCGVCYHLLFVCTLKKSTPQGSSSGPTSLLHTLDVFADAGASTQRVPRCLVL